MDREMNRKILWSILDLIMLKDYDNVYKIATENNYNIFTQWVIRLKEQNFVVEEDEYKWRFFTFLDILDSVKQHDCIYQYAGILGNIDILNWLYDKNFYYSTSAIAGAVYGDNKDAILWMKEKNFPYIRNHMHFSSDTYNDNDDMKEFLRKNFD